MSLDAISSRLGMTPATEPAETALATRAEPHHGTEAYEQKPFDLFESLSHLFDGPGNDSKNFDLASVLASIFDFAGKEAKQAQALPPKEHHEAGVKERVEVSGETGDEHFKAKGHAAAEAHALAQTDSETFIDGTGAGVRGSAEASVGASAEADGSITTDLGSIDGRARVSAEAYARAAGEARAGPSGASASGKAETGVMARADAASNLQLGEGLVAGHAEARAEAGAGGKATGKVGLSYDPAQAIVNARAESFAGARAGYSAQGGVAGYSYGIEGEVWAGAGAKAEINGGLDDDGKFKLEFSLGIAVGVGAMLKVKIEFDTTQFAKTVGEVVESFGKVFGSVGGMFGSKRGDGAHAAQLIAAATQDVAKNQQEPQEREWREEAVDRRETHGTLLEGTV